MLFSFRKLCTWALLVLAVSPFTPPFSTCDLHTMSHRAAVFTPVSPLDSPALGTELTGVTIADDDVDPAALVPVADPGREIADRLPSAYASDEPRRDIPGQRPVLRL